MNNELYQIMVSGHEVTYWIAISEEAGSHYFTPSRDEAYLFDSACTARNLIQQMKQGISFYEYYIVVK